MHGSFCAWLHFVFLLATYENVGFAAVLPGASKVTARIKWLLQSALCILGGAKSNISYETRSGSGEVSRPEVFWDP